jgi:hypothetical protein
MHEISVAIGKWGEGRATDLVVLLVEVLRPVEGVALRAHVVADAAGARKGMTVVSMWIQQ